MTAKSLPSTGCLPRFRWDAAEAANPSPPASPMRVVFRLRQREAASAPRPGTTRARGSDPPARPWTPRTPAPSIDCRRARRKHVLRVQKHVLMPDADERRSRRMTEIGPPGHRLEKVDDDIGGMLRNDVVQPRQLAIERSRIAQGLKRRRPRAHGSLVFVRDKVGTLDERKRRVQLLLDEIRHLSATTLAHDDARDAMPGVTQEAPERKRLRHVTAPFSLNDK